MAKRPARKRSISLSPETAVLIARRGPNYSASIRTMIAGYDQMVSCGLAMIGSRDLQAMTSGPYRDALLAAWDDVDPLPGYGSSLVERLKLTMPRGVAPRLLTGIEILALYDVVLQARAKR